MDVGGSDGLNRPPGFAPVLTPLRTPMALTYQEFKTVCLSSVQKHTHSHNSHSLHFYCSATTLTSKLTNNRNYRKPSEFHVCANSCKKLFQIDLDKSWNYFWYWYLRAPVPPLSPLWKGRGVVPPFRRPCCKQTQRYQCSTAVKNILFHVYCMQTYAFHLWCRYTQPGVSRLLQTRLSN